MRRNPISDFARYLRTETVGGLILLGATAVALLLANSPARDVYQAVRDFHIWELTVGDWAKDGLLALFFFVAGLELKRELAVGELSRFKAAILPVIAALGGMVVPIGIALAVGWGAPGMDQAWAIPAATDIAFALGVLSITASGLPSSARVFLLSLAVVDDLGAIVIIAILFTAHFNLIAAAAAIVLIGLYAYLQHKRIRSSWLYVPIALGTWFAVHESGIHATIAGVALGLLTRAKKDPYERTAPAIRLEHRLQPWSAGVAVPVFALFAAGVPISPSALGQMLDDRVAVAVIVGLLAGKLIGIFGATFAAVRLRLAMLPSDLGWRDMAAVSMLGGVGFTVSLLIADLSLDADAADRVKAAVLLASAVASLLAAAMLVRRSRAHRAT